MIPLAPGARVRLKQKWGDLPLHTIGTIRADIPEARTVLVQFDGVEKEQNVTRRYLERIDA